MSPAVLIFGGLKENQADLWYRSGWPSAVSSCLCMQPNWALSYTVNLRVHTINYIHLGYPFLSLFRRGKYHLDGHSQVPTRLMASLADTNWVWTSSWMITFFYPVCKSTMLTQCFFSLCNWIEIKIKNIINWYWKEMIILNECSFDKESKFDSFCMLISIVYKNRNQEKIFKTLISIPYSLVSSF